MAIIDKNNPTGVELLSIEGPTLAIAMENKVNEV